MIAENIDTTNTTTTVTALVVGSGVYGTLVESLPFLWVGLLLCLTSIPFGIAASLKKGEKFSFRKFIKSTTEKLVKYACWSLLGCSFSVAFSIPYINLIIIGAIYFIELDDIYSQYCFCKNIKPIINFKNLIKSFRKNGE